MATDSREPTPADLLLVDDDALFCEVLAEALSKHGYRVRTAHDEQAAIEQIALRVPHFAIIDLQLPANASGLALVKLLRECSASTRIVVLTGYASIATAVEAIKLGATHYLTKPADADQIHAAFGRTEGASDTPIPEQPISVNRLEWEHIHRVLQECSGNISAAARHLGMHRRTLQRKLNKHPVQR